MSRPLLIVDGVELISTIESFINDKCIPINRDRIKELLDNIDKKLERASLDFGEVKEARYKLISIEMLLGIRNETGERIGG